MTCEQIPRTARAFAVNIEILDASVYEISPSKAVRGLRACKRFILGYSWLAFSSYCEGKKLYKLRPKLLGHIFLADVSEISFTMQYYMRNSVSISITYRDL